VFRALGSAVLDGGLYDGVVGLSGRSYIVVDGLEFKNAAYPITLSNGASNNWLRNFYLHSSPNQGITIQGATDNRIEDSRIEDIGSEANNAGEGIFVQDGANRNVIARNTITRAGHGAIWISYQSGSEATSDDNLIEGNDLSNPWASGLGLNGKSNRTVAQCNKIHDTADGTRVNYPRAGVEIEGSANVLRFNEIYRTGRTGLTIQGRTFAGFVQNGVNNLVYNNTFWQNGLGANPYSNPAGALGFGSVELVEQDVGNVQGNIIQNNIFWDDNGLMQNGTRYAIAADLYHSNSPWAVGNMNGNVVRNNIFPTGQALFLVIRSGTNSSYTLAQAQATLAGWASNWQANPLFLNAAGADVRLQSTSPAIDAGVIVVPGILYLGNAPDLGAREGR
jgi:parallel beta helix pectate lyase-like protein